MSKLKDSLNNKSMTVTLDAEEKDFLTYTNKIMQVEVDMLQQRMAARFLNHLAVTKFGFEPNSTNLQFNYDPDKDIDNLTITEVRET